MSKKIIKRDVLYQQIWKKPASKLCKEYKISGSMLAKICTAMDVPRPPVGYWTKIQHGKKVQKPRLPKASEDIKVEWLINDPVVKNQNTGSMNKAKKAAIQKQYEDIAVLLDEIKTHKFVRELKSALNQSEVDHDGLISPDWGTDCLRLSVSPALKDRALKVFNGLLHFAKEAGLEVIKQEEGKRYGYSHTRSEVVLQWEEETLNLSLRETRKQKKKKEIESIWASREYRPSGVLELKVGGKAIVDKKTLQLETQLKGIAQEALEQCKTNKAWRLQRKQKEMHYEMMRDYEWAWRRQKEREDGEISKIIEQAAQLQKANILREYIARCEDRLTLLQEEKRDLEEIIMKLNFLKAKVKTIDPFEQYLYPWEIICSHTAIGVEPPSRFR